MKGQLYCLIIFILVISASCEKDKILDQTILGKWAWVKTYYGFTNYTATYKDRGYSFDILFDDYYYIEFKDNIPFRKMQYDLVIKQDTIKTNMYVRYEDGVEQNICFIKDTLLLFNWMGEGSLEYYIRK